MFKPKTKASIDQHGTQNNSLTTSTNTQPTQKGQAESEERYPTGFRLALIMFCLILATFLVALDGTIISTAIPTITSDLNSLADISWYNSAFLLTQCAFQLPFGRAYKLLSIKWTYLASILIFEIGSIVSGTTPTSIGLIIGRAIQGVGSAGIFGGGFVVIAKVTPLSKRPIFAGSLGATFVIASVVGPILGGAFTTSVTWRWCFYINLPLGAVALLVVLFFLQNIDVKEKDQFRGQTWLQILNKFDPIGSLVLIPSIICLLLALQWGGQMYPWSDGRIIALLVCFGVSIIGWSIFQYFQGDNATVPWRVARQRSVACATLYTLFAASAFTAVVYYLPLWFQGVKQDSAQESGIHQLPLTLSVVFSSLGCAGLVVLCGYYVPFLYFGTICMSVGAALLTLLKPNSGIGEWFGFQVLFGLGVGATFEQCNIAVQAVLPDEDIPAGTSLVIFARSLGGSLAAAIGESVFEQQLRSRLATVPNIDPSLATQLIGESGATDLLASVQAAAHGSQEFVAQVLDVYNISLTGVFYIALALGCLTIIPALGVEWKSVKKDKKKDHDEEKNDEVYVAPSGTEGDVDVLREKLAE